MKLAWRPIPYRDRLAAACFAEPAPEARALLGVRLCEETEEPLWCVRRYARDAATGRWRQVGGEAAERCPRAALRAFNREVPLEKPPALVLVRGEHGRGAVARRAA